MRSLLHLGLLAAACELCEPSLACAQAGEPSPMVHYGLAGVAVAIVLALVCLPAPPE